MTQITAEAAFNHADWFLHAHTAATMDARLLAVRARPQRIVLAGADGNESYPLLKARYPQAQFHEYDSRTAYLYTAAARRKATQTLWQKLSSQHVPQTAADTLPDNEQADMLWSNFGLLHQTDLAAVFDGWAAALQPEGLLFFAHCGPDSLKEIRALWQKHGIRVETPLFTDMHDLGDMLLQHGFYDPVTDTELLTLQYQQAQRLIADMQVAGIWQSLQFEDEAAAVQVLENTWTTGEVHSVTMELLYGHGVKKLRLPENESIVQFYPGRPKPPARTH